MQMYLPNNKVTHEDKHVQCDGLHSSSDFQNSSERFSHCTKMKWEWEWKWVLLLIYIICSKWKETCIHNCVTLEILEAKCNNKVYVNTSGLGFLKQASVLVTLMFTSQENQLLHLSALTAHLQGPVRLQPILFFRSRCCEFLLFSFLIKHSGSTFTGLNQSNPAFRIYRKPGFICVIFNSLIRGEKPPPNHYLQLHTCRHYN